MSGGLKVGDLYFAVTASIGAFQKSMKQIADDVAKTANKVKEAGEQIGRIGAVVSAGIGVAIAASAQSSQKMSDAVDKMKQLLFTMAAEIGDLFLPVVQSMSKTIGELVSWFQHLSPGVKQFIAHVATAVATITLAIGAIGKFAGVVGGLAKLVSLMSGLLGTAFIPIVVGVGVALLAIGALYNYWNSTDSKLRSSVMGLGETFAKVWEFVKDSFNFVVEFIFNRIAELTQMLGIIAATAGKVFGSSSLQDFGNAMRSTTGADMLKTTKEGLVTGAKAVGGAIKDGFGYAFNGLKELFGDMMKALGFGKGPAQLRFEKNNLANEPQHVSKTGGFTPGFRDLSVLGPGFDRALGRVVADELAAAIKAAKGRVVDSVVDAFGEVGDVFKKFSANLASGGPEAAIAELLGDLLIRSESFRTLVQMTQRMFQFLADTVGSVLNPLLPVVGAAFDVLASVLNAVRPAIVALTAPLEAVAPVLEVVAALINGLAPVITLVAEAMIAIQAPFLLIAGPVMRGLFEAIKFVGEGVLWVAIQISSAWNTVIGAIQWVLKKLSKLPFAGGLKDVANSLDSVKLPVDDLAKALHDLKGMTWEQAQAAAEASVELSNSGKAAKDVAEALTNVPQGFKIAKLRFDSQSAVAFAPPSLLAPAPSVGGSGGDTNVTIIVHPSEGMNEEELADTIARRIDSSNRRRTGNPIGGRLKFGGD
jgi:phage-related protein